MCYFKELFSPISIRGLVLKNRIVMPSMLTHMASINGEVTDRLIAYYAERARGGAGAQKARKIGETAGFFD